MRFIRKNGRVIPIRESKGEGYKKGYMTTGVLTAGSGATISAGAYKLQKGLEAMSVKQNIPNFVKHGKLGLGLFGAGIGLGMLANANALYRVAKSPKGKRAEEVAKHTAAAAVGAKVGAWASLPFLAGQLKAAGNTVHHAATGREINWKQIGQGLRNANRRIGSGGMKDVTGTGKRFLGK